MKVYSQGETEGKTLKKHERHCHCGYAEFAQTGAKPEIWVCKNCGCMFTGDFGVKYPRVEYMEEE